MGDVLTAFAPTLAVAGLALVLLPVFPPEHKRARMAAAWLTIALMLQYLVWRATSTLPAPAMSGECVVSYLYFAIEATASIVSLLLLHVLSRTSDRSAEASAHPVATHPGGPPLIDLFIPSYNEKREILLRTIVGAMAQDYPDFRVWVLDDGRRGWLRDLAGELGAGYLTRADNSHGKAGNMNAGFAHVLGLARPPDIIAILDADFVATPNFLARAAALMHDPNVAIVQTPQHFFNPDPIQLNLGAADIIPDEQRFFFDVILPSKDGHGTAFSCGTSGLARVSALKKVGGFPTESVTEDMLLSVKMTTIGMKTVYLNERLTVGLAPEGLGEYLTQRGRWCLGTMQIARSAWGPLSRRARVPLLMRLHTLDSVLYWSIGSVARLCFLIAPILYWWFGVYVMETDATSVLEHLGPSWLCTAIFLGWVSRGTNLPLFVEAMTLLTLFESLKASAIGLFGSKNQKFKVTAKGASRDSVVIHWSLIRWFLLLAALTLGGIVFSTIRGPVAGTPVVVEAVSFFWSVFNIATLLLASLMCVELPRFRGEERFRADEPAEIVADGRRLISRLTDVSVAGARFAMPDGICLPSGTDLRIRLRGVGVIPARVVRGRAGECHVAFLGETGRPALIRKIFSGNLSPAVTRLSMSALLAVVFRRAFG